MCKASQDQAMSILFTVSWAMDNFPSQVIYESWIICMSIILILEWLFPTFKKSQAPQFN